LLSELQNAILSVDSGTMGQGQQKAERPQGSW
jgi:hypothetical protein